MAVWMVKLRQHLFSGFCGAVFFRFRRKPTGLPHFARRERRHARSREGQDECPGSSSVRGARRWSETHTAALPRTQARAHRILRERPSGANFILECAAARRRTPPASARRRRAFARASSRARGLGTRVSAPPDRFPLPAREHSCLMSDGGCAFPRVSRAAA